MTPFIETLLFAQFYNNLERWIETIIDKKISVGNAVEYGDLRISYVWLTNGNLRIVIDWFQHGLFGRAHELENDYKEGIAEFRESYKLLVHEPIINLCRRGASDALEGLLTSELKVEVAQNLITQPTVILGDHLTPFTAYLMPDKFFFRGTGVYLAYSITDFIGGYDEYVIRKL